MWCELSQSESGIFCELEASRKVEMELGRRIETPRLRCDDPNPYISFNTHVQSMSTSIYACVYIHSYVHVSMSKHESSCSISLVSGGFVASKFGSL